MGELFEEFVSIKRSFLVEWSFILVIPNRFAKNPPEVFLSLATLISTCSPMMVMMMMMMMMMLILLRMMSPVNKQMTMPSSRRRSCQSDNQC